jgi:hypothetical protein
MSTELTKVDSTSNTEYLTADEDILVVWPTAGFKDTAESARMNVDYQCSFARNLGRPCGIVVVMNSLLSQNADARKIYAEGMQPELFYGIALVVSNPLSRAIGSFFMGRSKPLVRLTLVSSIDDGISWLQQLKAEKA